MSQRLKLSGVECGSCKLPLTPYWRVFQQPDPPKVLVLLCEACDVGFSAPVDLKRIDVFRYQERGG